MKYHEDFVIFVKLNWAYYEVGGVFTNLLSGNRAMI